MEKLQYRYVEAHYVPAKKRPYVVYWAHCCKAKKIVRKRQYVPNQYLGNILCIEINNRLQKGYLLNVDKAMTLGEGLDYYEKNKHCERYDTKRSYKSLTKIFREFCTEKNLIANAIQTITKKDIHEYLDYVMQERNNSSKSRNIKLQGVKSIFNFLVEREVISKNPANGIKRIREAKPKSQAIPTPLVPIIRELLKRKSLELYLLTSFIFYCFIRPKELFETDWTNVDLKNAKLFVPSTISKNGKSEYVIVPASMCDIIREMFPEGHPKTGLMFGDKKRRYVNFSELQKNILAEELLPKYTLYAWKHTGVTAFFRAGVNIKYIQQQCRHTSLDYTDKYLKGLGLIDNADAFDNIPRI